MLKKLLIVRHAHAEDGAESGRDFDRKLTSKGESYAIEMANELLQTDFRPQIIHSSPALRAKRTAELFAQTLQYAETQINLIEGIYEASIYNLLGIIARFSNEYDSVALFGHNPSLTYLADYLGHQPIDGLPKAGMVLIHFDVEGWAAITQGIGTTQWLKSPKNSEFF